MALVGSIVDHVAASFEENEYVKEAWARATGAQATVQRLADAEFPEDCAAFVNIIEALQGLDLAVSKWGRYSWKKRTFSFSVRTGKSNALKYGEELQALFDLLDRALNHLVAAVVVESYADLKEFRAEQAEAAEERRQEFAKATGQASSLAEDIATLEARLKAVRAEQREAEGRLEAQLKSLDTAVRDALMQPEESQLALSGGAAAALVVRAEEPAAAAEARLAACVAREVGSLAALLGLGEGGAGLSELLEDVASGLLPHLVAEVEAEGKATRAAIDAARALTVRQIEASLDDAVGRAVGDIRGEVQGAAEKILDRIDGDLMAKVDAIHAALLVMSPPPAPKRPSATATGAQPPGRRGSLGVASIALTAITVDRSGSGVLGRGSHGMVRRGALQLPASTRAAAVAARRHGGGGEGTGDGTVVVPVAVKAVSVDDGLAASALQQELRVLGSLRHRRLVHLYGTCYQPDSRELLAVLELCELGSVSQLLKVCADPRGREPEAVSASAAPHAATLLAAMDACGVDAYAAARAPKKQENVVAVAQRRCIGLFGGAIGAGRATEGVFRVASDVCGALVYLHGQGVVHCDLKSSNGTQRRRAPSALSSALNTRALFFCWKLISHSTHAFAAITISS